MRRHIKWKDESRETSLSSGPFFWTLHYPLFPYLLSPTTFSLIKETDVRVMCVKKSKYFLVMNYVYNDKLVTATWQLIINGCRISYCFQSRCHSSLFIENPFFKYMFIAQKWSARYCLFVHTHTSTTTHKLSHKHYNVILSQDTLFSLPYIAHIFIATFWTIYHLCNC